MADMTSFAPAQAPAPILIVEGADATGKTTFCKRYAATYGARYLHAEAPVHDDWLDEYVLPVVADRPIICDRWHLGELVWPEVFDRPSLFDEWDDYERCTRMLVEIGAAIIVVTRPVDQIACTLAQRGEEDTFTSIAWAQARFVDIAGRTEAAHIPVMTIDDLQGTLPT
jgi:hypothetical protein